MLHSILRYTALDDHVGFLQYKQAYLHIKIWKAAFYIHVFSSIFVLMAGLTQFSGKHGNLHRIVGRIYAFNIIFINFPAAMIMAVYANGLLPSKIAFIILDTLWCWFTVKAVIAVRKGDILKHKQYMIRSYALTCSAITLRTWKIILSATLISDPLLLYMADAWMGFVPNLLFAEWLIRSRLSVKKYKGKHEEQCPAENK